MTTPVDATPILITAPAPDAEKPTPLFLKIWAVLTIPVGLLICIGWLIDRPGLAVAMYIFLPVFLAVAMIIAAVITLVPAATIWLFIRLGLLLWRALDR